MNGNRHTFPSPMAQPAEMRINPKRDENRSRFSITAKAPFFYWIEFCIPYQDSTGIRSVSMRVLGEIHCRFFCDLSVFVCFPLSIPPLSVRPDCQRYEKKRGAGDLQTPLFFGAVLFILDMVIYLLQCLQIRCACNHDGHKGYDPRKFRFHRCGKSSDSFRWL